MFSVLHAVLTIGWEFDLYVVNESEGMAEICAVVREGTVQAVFLPLISVTLSDGTASSSGKQCCMFVIGVIEG